MSLPVLAILAPSPPALLSLILISYNDLQSEVTLTIVGCYSCFLIAEGTPLHTSGVLSVVFFGLYLSFYGARTHRLNHERRLHFLCL